MKIDIRYVIGSMFVVFGVLLAVFGLVSDSEIYKRSLNININIIWGVVLLIFGSFMLFLAIRAHRPAGK